MPDTRSILEAMSKGGGTVLHVMRVRTVAGAERHLIELARGLREQGWESDVLVAAPRPDTLGHLLERLRGECTDVRVRRMPAHLSPSLFMDIRSAVRGGRYDVVHLHLVHADWHGGAAAAASAERCAVVSTKHNHDPFRRRAGVRAVERWTAKRCDAVIAISQSLADFTAEFSGVEPVTISYGLDAGALPPERPSTGGSRLLAVGRLEDQKAFDILLEAMRGVADAEPTVRLSIAGDGPQRASLVKRRQRLGLDEHVELLGWREDVNELLAQTDALVHPSRWEGFGLVLLEAMRSARPIIATSVGAIPEVVVDGQTGLLVPPGDAEALAAAILHLMRMPDRGAALGRAGRERILDRFTPARMAAATADVYERALTARSLRRDTASAPSVSERSFAS